MSENVVPANAPVTLSSNVKSRKEKKVALTAKSFTEVTVDGVDFFRFGRLINDSIARAVDYTQGYGFSRHYRDGFPVDFLISILGELREYSEDHELESEFEDIFKRLDVLAETRKDIVYDRLKNGKLLFEDIPLAFPPNTEVVVGRGDEAFGGIVDNVRRQATMFGNRFIISLRVINNHPGRLSEQTESVSVYGFDGLAAMQDLPLRTITDEARAALTERGRLYRRFVTGSAYASYDGTLVQESYWSRREYRSTGRVMVDMMAFRQIDPNTYDQMVRGYDHCDDETKDKAPLVIADDDLWRCSPHLYGFSFSAKKWGRLNVAGLRDVAWRDDAFDKLVLPEDDKQMVRALVEHHTGSFSDIVEGKGGGVIFLLHGQPGQGKTLLAETVAEILHKPLYMISVGELGTDPDQLEDRLRTILDVASMWDAVLLLDEADIFLEARNEQDIVRNAMVGVFLRLLEYHQGVMFLTTNRVRNIDQAFYSRISVALSFPGSDEEKRAKIWSNLLTAANIDVDASGLAVHDINGRQIKNSIRLAQTLARSENREVTIEHLTRTISLTTRFASEIKD